MEPDTQNLVYPMRVIAVSPAPKNIEVSKGTYTEYIKVSWDKDTNSYSNYKIYRSSTYNGNYTYVGIVGGSVISYNDYINDSTVISGTRYFYKVTAVVENIESRILESGYDYGYTKVIAPVNVIATKNTYTDKIKITWNAIYGAKSYEIRRASSASTEEANYVQIGMITDSATLLNPVFYDNTSVSNAASLKFEKAKRYYYKIKAAYSDGTSTEFNSVINTEAPIGWARFPKVTGLANQKGFYFIDEIKIKWDSVFIYR